VPLLHERCFFHALKKQGMLSYDDPEGSYHTMRQQNTTYTLKLYTYRTNFIWILLHLLSDI
jgi:hypothetical protein